MTLHHSTLWSNCVMIMFGCNVATLQSYQSQCNLVTQMILCVIDRESQPSERGSSGLFEISRRKVDSLTFQKIYPQNTTYM